MARFKSYMDAKSAIQDIVNGMPMMWAFSDKQFAEQAQKCGYDNTDDFARDCYRGLAGGFYLKKDKDLIRKAYDDMAAINAEIEADDDLLYQMLFYEMGNHECQLTHDYESMLEDIVSADTLKTERFMRIFARAKRDFIQDCDENDRY